MPAKPSPRFDLAAERNAAAPVRRGSLQWVKRVLGRSLRLEPPRPVAQASPGAAQADQPLPIVVKQRAELGARLLVHDPATQVVRHLFIVHDELRNGGWVAVEALPRSVIARAVTEAEILASEEPSHLLATIIDALRAIKIAADAGVARQAHEAREGRWEVPQMPEVSDTNFDEYELMERSWAGTVPNGLREASRNTR